MNDFLENISFFFFGNHGEVAHALWVRAIVQKHQKNGGIMKNQKMHYDKRKAKR